MTPALIDWWFEDPLPVTLAPMYSRDWWRWVSKAKLQARGWV